MNMAAGTQLRWYSSSAEARYGMCLGSQVEEVLQETIYFVPADARMEAGKPVSSSHKCVFELSWSCFTGRSR